MNRYSASSHFQLAAQVSPSPQTGQASPSSALRASATSGTASGVGIPTGIEKKQRKRTRIERKAAECDLALYTIEETILILGVGREKFVKEIMATSENPDGILITVIGPRATRDWRFSYQDIRLWQEKQKRVYNVGE